MQKGTQFRNGEGGSGFPDQERGGLSVDQNGGWSLAGKKAKGRKRDCSWKFFADSHGRDMAKRLKGAEVHFKGGANLDGVVEGVDEGGVSKCIVIMGGTNDTTQEGVKKGLNKLRSKVDGNQRVLVVGVPMRYDLYPNVQTMISRKNEMIQSFCDHYKYDYLDISDSRRDHYTRHGLHFNFKGKNWLATKIMSAVNKLL